MSTIPASNLVSVTPSVLSAGGAALDMTGLILSTSTRVPIGAVQPFPNEIAVGDYFGPTSKEATIAGIYFGGFTNAAASPASILFAQYNTAAVSAYLRGGNISAISIATLQSYNGVLNVTVDGNLKSQTINLSAATSFSNAASIIGSTLGIEGVQVAAVTGSVVGGTLSVSFVTSGTVGIGQVLNGTGLGAANLYITGFIGGAGGTGTYTLSAASSGASQSLTLDSPGVQYDSVSGAFVIYSGSTGINSTITYGSGTLANSLLLTQATGAILSQGAAATTPAAFMNGVIQVTQNWVNFMTAFDPDNGSGNTQKQAFAAWKDTQNDRYGYVCWDTDITPTISVPATSSLGYILAQNGDSGTCLLYESSDVNLSAFICGAAASIDFTETNGRITFAYKWQAGLSASVTSNTVAANLLANGYNCGGAYGAANANFTWFQNGQCTGPFAWFDSYLNQIWLNNAFQLALLNLLGNAKSIPYNPAGNSLIEAALADPISAGLNFGAFAPGTISSEQSTEVNQQAGANISNTLQTQGWYLQVLPAPATVRAARGSPPCTFWYLDRGSVQQINLSSVAVQ